MTDLFRDKAEDWDARPVPTQISQGVFDALEKAVALTPEMTVMDFGAGTGLLGGKLANRVGHLLAVDVSRAMLDKLMAKPELEGKVEAFCQNILESPLPRKVDLVVSAMAMHHVEDTRALFRVLFEHLVPGGRIALADLETEQGDFHAPGTEGVYHAGFDPRALCAIAEEVGFVDATFVTACSVGREQKRYPIFLLTATKKASA
jgi:putative AdoMet-dependent methyltransferase